MNVYDFDGTILTGDSEIYFNEYMYENYNIKYKYKLIIKIYKFLYKIRIINSKTFLNHYYLYLKEFDDIDKIVKEFWDLHYKYIKDYYFKNHKDDDVVVSATPRFLLIPIMDKLNIKTLIATEFDLKECKVIGKTCKGTEKVNRYNEVFNELKFDNYYFDSDSDLPLMEYSKNGYRISGNEIKKVK